MAIKYCYRRLYFAALISLSAVVNSAQSSEIITLTNGEWPPFTSQSLPHQGFYSEIVRQAFALEGYQVQYEFLPWARAYMYVEQGQADGSLTWAKTPAKGQQVLFSDPVFWHNKVIFHLKSAPFDWQTVSDFKGLKIGASEQYTYGYEFDLAAEKGEIDVEYVSSDLLNLKKMLINRIRLFPSDVHVGHQLIKQHFSAEQAALFTHHPKPIQQTYTHVIFSKHQPSRSEQLLAAFNRGLKKLKESGAYQDIIDQAELITHDFSAPKNSNAAAN
ncbi:transporter substrate-binding domain-containing protein [Agarivorans sp. TSD2052]|uniref:substrate-binding periplasmic protein n=1 Tax=Agarivorans sp. TSD2052 TaxID=2937286 RepID=UPI00200ED98C|nr:transporter substrate-binding domain-containing protein [Agarivorans sp. TSD2052]UPW17477.1 transporter substrate-binding domain-containing protein [Agarivorans sp. TSD2052]